MPEHRHGMMGAQELPGEIDLDDTSPVGGRDLVGRSGRLRLHHARCQAATINQARPPVACAVSSPWRCSLVGLAPLLKRGRRPDIVAGSGSCCSRNVPAATSPSPGESRLLGLRDGRCALARGLPDKARPAQGRARRTACEPHSTGLQRYPEQNRCAPGGAERTPRSGRCRILPAGSPSRSTPRSSPRCPLPCCLLRSTPKTLRKG